MGGCGRSDSSDLNVQFLCGGAGFDPDLPDLFGTYLLRLFGLRLHSLNLQLVLHHPAPYHKDRSHGHEYHGI